jgi:hypothetical protein
MFGCFDSKKYSFINIYFLPKCWKSNFSAYQPLLHNLWVVYNLFNFHCISHKNNYSNYKFVEMDIIRRLSDSYISLEYDYNSDFEWKNIFNSVCICKTESTKVFYDEKSYKWATYKAKNDHTLNNNHL